MDLVNDDLVLLNSGSEQDCPQMSLITQLEQLVQVTEPQQMLEKAAL